VTGKVDRENAKAPAAFVEQTLASFDWQWAHLPAGDFMPGDPWFDEHSARILANEMCGIAPAWFRNRAALDAGCGMGRWTRALLELGARVTAVDFSEAGLARTAALCGAGAALTTERVNLLEVPADLRARRFDLVFSYGVLHHTGDTWKALDNVAALVADRGALFLYLYGAPSFSATAREALEKVRLEVASLSFEQKIEELRRRFPADDPHQLFDLMSPLINDRLEFDDVAERLRARGFVRVDRTIQSGEIYLRATRAGFPEEFLLPPATGDHTFAAEISRRHAQRLGAGFEDQVRAAVRRLDDAARSSALAPMVADVRWGRTVLDVSFPPDRLPRQAVRSAAVRDWEGPSPATPGIRQTPADTVVHLGATLGAGRMPDRCLTNLWHHVAGRGTLVVEVAGEDVGRLRRTLLDRVRDARVPVPEKVARMLRRHRSWCTGQALAAVGGATLLNPFGGEAAVALLRDLGATDIERRPTHRGSELVIARRAG
jgi:SAM-dependent methyltransferase